MTVSGLSFVAFAASAAVRPVLDAEKDRERQQDEAGELLGALAQRLVQLRAEPETELGDEERLRADQDDGEPERRGGGGRS